MSRIGVEEKPPWRWVPAVCDSAQTALGSSWRRACGCRWLRPDADRPPRAGMDGAAPASGGASLGSRDALSAVSTTPCSFRLFALEQSHDLANQVVGNRFV